MSANFNAKASAIPSVIDRSVTILNGQVNGLKISDPFNLIAGKTYTVCVVDNVKDINYTVFFGDIGTNIPIQMNGVNKGFGVIGTTYFGTLVPDTSATVYAYLYQDGSDILENRYLRVLVLEGEYSYNQLLKHSEEVFDYSSYGLPVLKLSGSTAGMSKDDKVNLGYEYGELSGTCSVKWQGSSSITYPKKNYTIVFDTAFEAVEGWGEQSKYCLKANYIDFSHARNVVSAKLWGQIVKSRTTQNDNLFALHNGGAIDGFPIVVVINDEYQGLYTFNIPKDKWLLGMGNADTEYIVGTNVHSTATRFKSEITVEELQNGDNFEIEYIPDGVSDQTVVNSLNALINTCINSTGSNYRDTVGKYIDMDSAIDYYIFACLLCAVDALDKNYLLGTYDGEKWFFSAYDLDTTFGNHWNGKSYYNVAATPTFDSYNDSHRLMHLIYTYDKEALKARYKELRAGVLSEANILDTFSNFIVNIPKAVYDEEVKTWREIPGTQTNNLSQIVNYYMLRCKVMDAEIEAL
jgi:hypothetical protein